MLFSSALAVFLISWSSLFLLDYVLRLKNCVPYVEFAAKYGLEVSPFQFRLYTSRSDDATLLLERKSAGHSIRRTLCYIWFGIGALVSLACLFGITFYLGKLLCTDITDLASRRPHVAPYRAAVPTEAEPLPPSLVDDLPPAALEEYDILDGGQRSSDGLVPIIPGVNLPWSHIPVFMVVLITAAVVHELGHSIAATSNNVDVNGFGIFIFAIYPGAFTDIEPESLKRASPMSRLMIFGGGIWHNLVLAAVAYLLFMATPTLLSPLFIEGAGVTVTEVDARSGLYGPAGLSPGFVVESIENCPIRRLSDWRECVRQLEHQQNGRCVLRSQVETSKSQKATVGDDEIHCCEDFTNITHAHMCFESTVLVVSRHRATRAPSLNKVLQMGLFNQTREEVVQKSEEWSRQFSCMSARQVTDQPICNVSQLCEQNDHQDPSVCVFPALYNGTQLARITVKDHPRPVLYVGNLDELISFVVLHGLVPRWSWVSWWWADTAELIPKYFFTLSIALGVLNAVPCYALDGQYIVITLVNSFCRSLPKRRRQFIISLILFVGTGLLASNILIGFVKFLF